MDNILKVETIKNLSILLWFKARALELNAKSDSLDNLIKTVDNVIKKIARAASIAYTLKVYSHTITRIKTFIKRSQEIRWSDEYLQI